MVARRSGEELLQYMRLVHFEAKRLEGVAEPASMTLMDLCQEGFIGLLDAQRRFDPQRGVKFSTYARWWVRSNMTRAIKENPTSAGMRVRSGKAEQLRNLTKLIRNLSAFLSRPPKDCELIESGALYLNLNQDHMRELLGISQRRTVGLQTTVSTGDGEEDFLIEEALTDDGSLPDEATITDQLLRLVGAQLERLEIDHYIVLCLRYGLFGNDAHTQQEIAILLQIDRHSVGKMERAALHKLRFTVLEKPVARVAK